MADIKKVFEEGNVTKYLVKGTNHVFMNSIRRSVMCHVPCLAVDTVHIYENDSVIFDEMLANRLALCPITTPVETTGKKVTFTLEKKGPCTVYSGDLISNDPEVKMVYDNIPLTKLREDDKISLTAYAVLGKGADHAKFNPAIVGYQQLAELEVLRGCDSCQKCVDALRVNQL